MYIKIASIIEILIGSVIGGLGGLMFGFSSIVVGPTAIIGFILGVPMMLFGIFLIIFGINLLKLKKWAWLASIVILIIVIAFFGVLISKLLHPIFIFSCVIAIICLILLILGRRQFFPVREAIESLPKIQIEKKISIPWKKILIITALVAVGAMGYLGYHWYKTSQRPAPLPIPKEEWTGTITSINVGEKIIEAQGINATIRSSVLPETIIEDKRGNPFSLDVLKEGDFVSIFGAYQMTGKMTPEWKVVIVAEKITVLGECIKEGEEKTSGIWCCPNLTLIDQKYCTKCGDGVCKPPENQENCPLDCTKISEAVSISIFIDVKSFNLDNKTFEGQTRPERKNVKVLTTDSTKFYRTAEPSWGKEYFTFSEFYSLLKNWSGPSWPFTVKGILEKEDAVRADEVFMIAQ